MVDYLVTKDYLVSGERFVLQHDPEKDLLKTSPIPDELAPYYQSKEYTSHTDSSRGIVQTLYQWVKAYSIKRKLKWISQYAGNRRSLLDIGAGTGELLRAAQEYGFEIAGVEPNEVARKKALEKGIEISNQLQTNRKFQIISLWHVLEHLKDPFAELSQLKKHLEADGSLFIALPNFRSGDAQYYKEYWAAYDVPRHLWHFSKKAMKELLDRLEMDIVEIKPMPFDAYYVSILSEKYKSGRNRFVKAFLSGFQSNLAARKNGEYSSLLYIAKKRL